MDGCQCEWPVDLSETCRKQCYGRLVRGLTSLEPIVSILCQPCRSAPSNESDPLEQTGASTESSHTPGGGNFREQTFGQ